LAHGGIVQPLRKSVKLKRIGAGLFVQLAASRHPKVELLDGRYPGYVNVADQRA
jgi:hypothetical protein